MKHRSSARELTAVSGGIGNLTGARNRQSDQPRSSTGEKGIGILLPPSFEILEPGRLSISGETDARRRVATACRDGQSSQAILQGGQEIVVPLAAKAAGHELRFLRNCPRTLLQLSRGLAHSTIDLDCRALPRQTASTEKPRAGALERLPTALPCRPGMGVGAD